MYLNNMKQFDFFMVYSRSDTNTNNIVWIDMEMTGLDVINDHILEIACIVTDSKLNIISEGPDIIVHQDDSILNNMDEWCVTQHGRVSIYLFLS